MPSYETKQDCIAITGVDNEIIRTRQHTRLLKNESRLLAGILAYLCLMMPADTGVLI